MVLNGRLLLNFLLVLLLPLVYHIFGFNAATIGSRRNRIILTTFTGLSMTLCMTYPFTLAPGRILDLRQIPSLIGVLYGGYEVGIFLSIIFYAYRFWLGGPGFALAALIYPLTLVGAFWIRSRFQRLSRQRRVATGVLLALFSAFLTCMLALIFVRQSAFSVTLWIEYPLLSVFGMWMVLSILEHIEESARLRNEIQMAEKYHVLGELAASIAHEIRNPMTVARGFIQLIGYEKNLTLKQKDQLALVMGEIDRAQTIINNYLSFAKPQASQPCVVDITIPLTYIAEMLTPYGLQRNVEIRLRAAEEPIHVLMEQDKFIQASLNIVKNGIEAMPSGGTLEIHVHKVATVVEVRIIDTGIGMTQEETGRLGNPFYSTKASGTGLGMMISYSILHSMKGTIAVHSEKGFGTRFEIRLPIVSSANEQILQ